MAGQSKKGSRTGSSNKKGSKVSNKKGSMANNKKGSKVNNKKGSKINNKKGSKKKVIIIIEKDVLGKYGYDNIKNISATKRHIALKKALKELKPLSVYRRLIAIATLNKNKDNELFDILRADAEWVKNQAM
jgi:hypothetical protein